MSEPRTEAGRQMLADLHMSPNSAGLAAILAIEAEAARAAVEARDRELRAAIEALDCWLSGPSVVGIVHGEGLVTVGRDAVLALLDSAPADAG